LEWDTTGYKNIQCNGLLEDIKNILKHGMGTTVEYYKKYHQAWEWDTAGYKKISLSLEWDTAGTKKISLISVGYSRI
jgi:hypothetical protein